jgi:hypothetical protein
MKTVRVKYTFEVTRNVLINELDAPPKPYNVEEWEKQQIEDIGQQMEFALDGQINWYYHRLDD